MVIGVIANSHLFILRMQSLGRVVGLLKANFKRKALLNMCYL